MAYIKQLTKADMMEFYSHYILPSSPKRSKVVVYLVAQMAGGISADHLSDLLGRLDLPGGDEAAKEAKKALHARLEERVSGAAAAAAADHGRKQALAVISGFLTDDLGVSAAKAKEVMVAFEAELATADAAVPVTGCHGEVAANGTSRVVIDDVRAFKAGLPVSVGATPVKHISEFEEIDPKL